MGQVSKTRGMSLVDVIVGMFIMSTVFLALFAAFNSTYEFGARNRLRAAALLLANTYLEQVRALPYDAIGTVNGLPPGNIPQVTTTTEDGETYTRRTFIQYVDDPADGLDAADPLAADYKRIKIEISYDYRGVTQSFSLTTSVAPKSQESLAGAGILRINVTDATNNALASANVHIVNTTVATSVDITTFTNASGTISFPGAWAGAGYTITVTKPGYSSAQTYGVTAGNPSPSPSAATVAEHSTTEIYFKIDLLSSLEIYLRNWPTRSRFLDDFADATQLATTSDTQVAGGSLTLLGGVGTYAAVGTGTSITIAPPSLGSWLLFSFEQTVPAQTNTRYQVEYDAGGGIFIPIPEGDLPGNTLGFVSSPISLNTLSISNYPSLRVRAILTTSDPNVTPEVTEWKVSYREQDVPIANASFSLIGSKTIGTDSGGNPVYKYNGSHQTNGVGVWNSATMEWDEYTLTIPGYTIAEACPALPLILDPNTVRTQTLTLATVTADALKLQVNDALGAIVPNAEVRLVGGSTDTTRASGPCGVAYFPGLTADTYTATVTAAGYTSQSVPIAVSGLTSTTITLTP
jgi:Tfp pilus assembly protein PilV